MTYCLASDLVQSFDDDVLIQLTDDADSGQIITEVLDKVCVAVSGEIDGYLSKRYTLPLSDQHLVLKSYAVNMCLYRLYCRKQGPPEWVVKMYDDAIGFLKMVATGQADILPSSVSASVSVDSSERIFTREKMAGF
jgi:phage gp36-like protein